MRLLLQARADVNMGDPAARAFRNGQAAAFNFLLQAGARDPVLGQLHEEDRRSDLVLPSPCTRARTRGALCRTVADFGFRGFGFKSTSQLHLSRGVGI